MVELGTVPMFGGRKIVRATTGRRINGPMLKSLVEGAPLAGVLIVEAGNLKPDDVLRAAFEKSPACAAIACYGDNARDIEALIREALGAKRLTISTDAKTLLIDKLGADRVMTRSEIEKLALYVRGKAHIEADDVEAIVGDASEQTIDRLVNAAASGDAARTATEFARAIGAGESAQGLIAATERHFQRLHRVRTSLDAGRPFEDAIRALRPSVHFKQKDPLAAQCRQWTTPRLGAALAHIANSAKAARLAGPLEEAHAERLLLALAVMARTRAR
jgi:DNA polymerase-3 subunit delta